MSVARVCRWLLLCWQDMRSRICMSLLCLCGLLRQWSCWHLDHDAARERLRSTSSACANCMSDVTAETLYVFLKTFSSSLCIRQQPSGSSIVSLSDTTQQTPCSGLMASDATHDPLSIAYYCTGHGLGHATRSIEVCKHLVERGHR